MHIYGGHCDVIVIVPMPFCHPLSCGKNLESSCKGDNDVRCLESECSECATQFNGACLM